MGTNTEAASAKVPETTSVVMMTKTFSNMFTLHANSLKQTNEMINFIYPTSMGVSISVLDNEGKNSV